MPDKFQSYTDVPSFAARKQLAITPNDSTDLVDVPKALWVGVGGTLTTIAVDDTASVQRTVPQGYVLLRVRRVLATGTTASGIVGEY